MLRDKGFEMDCQKTKEYLYPFIDGELDRHTYLLVEEHISACPLCHLELEKEKRVDSLIRNNLSKENAPYELKEKILTSLENLEEKEFGRFTPRILKPALAGITLLSLIIILFSWLNKPFPVFSEAIKEHIMFLQGKLPMDVTSGKPKEISSWLQAKVDFKVMVPDLSSQGVNIFGAGLCAFKDKRVAYIMYGKNGHRLSVFMFDAKGMRLPRARKIFVNNKIFYLSKEKGYNSVVWFDEGIACVFVSDLGEAELLHLASL
jgi:anti-sigma factor (TIGR02949 family)